MFNPELGTSLYFAFHLLTQVALCIRVLLRPHRQPASRMAWIVVIFAVPIMGIVAYLLLGEVNIGRRRIERMRSVLATMPPVSCATNEELENVRPHIPERFEHLFRVADSINGFKPIGGNHAQLMATSNATIDRMVADIDAAKCHVSLLFYIWLPDNNGLKIVEALKRAAARQVTCRAMADGLGSRSMIASPHWPAMQAAAVHLAVALRIGNPFVRSLTGRIDLRNHRKIVVIDGQDYLLRQPKLR